MEIFIATSNPNKVKEFKEMLEPHGYAIKSLLDLPESIDIEETGTTFEENALIKAQAISNKFSITCVADDSGLEIDALNKEPGINSARYLGHDTPYDVKNAEILKRMENVKGNDRSCRFVCALAFVEPGKKPIVFRETVEGLVADQVDGDQGFGYDPIFFYPPFNKTLSQVSLNQKNEVSHRGKAIKRLEEILNEKQ